LYKKKWVSLVLITFLMVFVLGPVNYASADAIGDVVTEMQEIYKYMDECDKDNIRAARTALQDFAVNDDEDDWDAVLEDLLTTEVIEKFEGEATARAVAKEIFTDLGDIYYSTDESDLKNKLEQFKEKYLEDFQLLFGDDFSMEEFYQLFADARSALSGVINDVEAGKLANATNAELVEAMPGYLEKAMDAALLDNTVFSGKLGAIGWSTEKLIVQQEALADFIDQDGKARLSLALALVRSETKLAAGLTTLQVGESYAANETYTINIMGRNATSLVAWASGDLAIVEIGEDAETGNFQINARAPGTTELIVYRDYAGAVSDCDWLLKFDVTVVGAGVAVNGTITSWNEIADDAVIRLYSTTYSDEEIRADMKDGNPENALENAAILGTSIDYDGVSKRYIQSFSFADVEAGTYKVAVYQAKEYLVKVAAISVDESNTEIGALKLWLYGDVNDNGQVNSIDIQRLFEHLNGTDLLTDEEALIIADVNSNDELNSLDIQRLFEHLNGSDPLF